MTSESNTRFKLDEARHYLTLLDSLLDKPERFLYTFSAYLSAARSVTFLMQAEFSKDKAFEEWYRSKVNHALFRLFNDLRVENVHCSVLQLHFRSTFGPADSPMGGKMLYHMESFGLGPFGRDSYRRFKEVNEKIKDAQGKGMKETVEWRFPSTGESVIEASIKYFDLLEKLVNECEKRHLQN